MRYSARFEPGSILTGVLVSDFVLRASIFGRKSVSSFGKKTVPENQRAAAGRAAIAVD
jgi:hypothetical protein